jgi:hypothetical protein
MITGFHWCRRGLCKPGTRHFDKEKQREREKAFAKYEYQKLNWFRNVIFRPEFPGAFSKINFKRLNCNVCKKIILAPPLKTAYPAPCRKFWRRPY